MFLFLGDGVLSRFFRVWVGGFCVVIEVVYCFREGRGVVFGSYFLVIFRICFFSLGVFL